MSPDLANYGSSYPRPPSPLRRFVDSLQAASNVSQGVTPYVKASLHGLRSAGTSGALAITLGAIDSKFGLDVGKRKVPVDGLLALAGLGASIALARDPDGLTIEARATMATAESIFLFRKTKEWMDSTRRSASRGERTTKDLDEDPVMAAARGLEDVAAE